MDEQEIIALLSQADKAYKKKNKRKGAQLINQILREDYTNSAAWNLLFKLFGSNQNLQEFQVAFTQKYYPEKLPILNEAIQDLSKKTDPSLHKEIIEKSPPHTPSPFQRTSSPEHTIKPNNQDKFQRDNASPRRLSDQAATFPQRFTPVKPIPKKPGEKTSIVVVDDSAQTRENIMRSLRFQENMEVIGTASSGAEAIQISRELQPDVIIMDVSMPDMDGITATANIKKLIPFSQVIILTVEDDVDYIRRAMMAGARDFLSKPPAIDELVTAIQRASEIAFLERQKITTIDEALATGLLAFRGKIITVYSPKGGAGATMFASNLAAAFYEDDTAVALIDGNLQFGDVPVFYNAQSNKSTLDLTSHSNELSPELVEETLYKHHSGIRILPPPRPEEAEYITEDQFSRVLEFLRGLYPYVIVDTVHQLTEATFSAIKVSDVIVLITTQDIPSIARTRRFLDFLYNIEVDHQKIILVLNQYDKRIGITEDKVSEVLNMEVSAVLPVDKATVIPSINRGAPFMLQKEMVSKPIAKEILKSVEKIREKITQLEKVKQEQAEEKGK